MLRKVVFSVLPAVAILASAAPAFAQDNAELNRLATAYQECVAKHDAACVASLYSKDGVQINPRGVFNDIKTLYEGNFKSGAERVVITVDNVTTYGNDAAITNGQSVVTYKTDKGDKDVTLLWGDYLVREDGQMKIRMLVVMPKAEPQKEAKN